MVLVPTVSKQLQPIASKNLILVKSSPFLVCKVSVYTSSVDLICVYICSVDVFFEHEMD